MRYCVLILLIFMLLPALSRNAAAAQTDPQAQGVLIRNISIEGFVLQDKNQFIKLFKPFRNKHMTADDMDAILKEIQVIYEKEGYQQLVSITYHVDRHHLVFTALMTS